MKIGSLEIQAGRCAVVAEPSANHCGSLRKAEQLVRAAKEAGADAIKFQVYEPDEMAFPLDHPAYRLKGSAWAGSHLWDLYSACQTPHSWMRDLTSLADDVGLPWFASVFSERGIETMEGLGCPAYKVASPEVCDTRFVEQVAATGKPIIISDGAASMAQMAVAMGMVARDRLVVLKCVSEYPADPKDYNLATVRELRTDGVLAGVSDHTNGNVVAAMAVALGAVMIEKHLMLDDFGKQVPPDVKHSVPPAGFVEMVRRVRQAESAVGDYKLGSDGGSAWRRRLVAARALHPGHVVMPDDVRTARCGEGLEPYERVVGRTLAVAVSEGEPLTRASFGYEVAA